MPGWVVDYPELLAAASTVLLALFAAVQIGLEMYRRHRAVVSAHIEAVGPAWLARRTLEQALVFADGLNSAQQWAFHTGRAEGLDRIEGQMLDVVRLGGDAGGKLAEAAEAAFEQFLAYADSVNALRAFRGSRPDGQGGYEITAKEEAQLQDMGNAALDHLRSAVENLEKIAPRRPHEGVLPEETVVAFSSQE